MNVEIEPDDRDAYISRLEGELEASQRREQDLTDFIENASLPLHWVGRDGRILWANQAELDLLGYTKEEYVGHPIADFHADQEVIDDILARLQRKETLHSYEARLRRKDGSICYVLISSNVRWNDNEFLHTRCFTRDITKRKRHEQRLRTQFHTGRLLSGRSSLSIAAPELLRLFCEDLEWRAGLFWTLQEASVLGCEAVWDQRGATTDFARRCRQLIFPSGVGLPGRVLSSAAPAWISDLQHDANFPRGLLAHEQELRSAFAFPVILGGRVFGVMEFFAETPEEPDEDLLKMASSVGYQVGEFVERVRAQRELLEREESYRVLTETASDGIMTMDEDGTILFANAAAARMFGYSAEELVGADVMMLVPEPLRASHAASLAGYIAAREHDQTLHAFPFVGEHRHGYEIHVEVSVGEYRLGSKEVFVGVLRDASERRRLDQALNNAAKLESLGVLAGGIAHDFNNLLTGILGNISLALDTASESDDSLPLLRDAMEASERAASLTRQLLAYAGRGRFVIEATDLSVMIEEISTMLRRSIPKHVTLRLDLQEPIFQVNADVAQMQQLIMNIVINAAEATPGNGEGLVLVRTRSQTIDAEAAAALGMDEIRPGDYVIISIQDNGVGMDEETLGKIFDPFFTTKFTGRGLGLAAALGIVRGHKGGLKVFSSPGQGTTFRILLPAAAGARPRVQEPAAPQISASSGGLVLVVDDELSVRKIAESTLRKYGYSVVTAENGREGVDRFRELHSELAAVILDMTMPVMSGEEAIVLMRRISPRVPVVLSSGYSEIEATRQFSGKGVAGFIQKPYTAAALAQKIETIVREWQFSGS